MSIRDIHCALYEQECVAFSPLIRVPCTTLCYKRVVSGSLLAPPTDEAIVMPKCVRVCGLLKVFLIPFCVLYQRATWFPLKSVAFLSSLGLIRVLFTAHYRQERVSFFIELLFQ